jgi:hypothetical protein
LGYFLITQLTAMKGRWITVIIAATVTCGPGPGEAQQASRVAKEMAEALILDERWAPGVGWSTTALLPPPKVKRTPAIEFILPTVGAQWTEGSEQVLLWHWTGPITKVRLYYEYELCRVGGVYRGGNGGLITQMIPNRGYTTWVVPWMDASGFWLRVAGYDDKGNKLAWCERFVQLRPKEARNLRGTFIVILRERQRLFFFRDDKLVRMHVISTGRSGYSTPKMLPGVPGWGTRMGKVFNKVTYAWSRAYSSPMPYWMAITSNGMIGIHATTPLAYRRLGGVASHGCIRQHGEDARQLFKMVDVGTPVYVF